MSLLSSGWFKGLSSTFLATRAARLLVLAGTDRLDKELMIGQMQGKFQQSVVPGVGHMLHEVRSFSFLFLKMLANLISRATRMIRRVSQKF